MVKLLIVGGLAYLLFFHGGEGGGLVVPIENSPDPVPQPGTEGDVPDRVASARRVGHALARSSTHHATVKKASRSATALLAGVSGVTKTPTASSSALAHGLVSKRGAAPVRNLKRLGGFAGKVRGAA
jgi:hypothetical protein